MSIYLSLSGNFTLENKARVKQGVLNSEWEFSAQGNRI